MKRTYLPLGALMVAAGCYVGPQPRVPEVALHPAGAEVTLETSGGEMVGELLALRPEAMVIRTEGPTRLVVVPLSLIQGGRSATAGAFGSGGPRFARLQHLRLTSRYPHGIDAELESALLRAYGIPRLEVLAP